MTTSSFKVLTPGGILIADRSAQSLNHLGTITSGSYVAKSTSTGNPPVTNSPFTSYSFYSSAGAPTLGFIELIPNALTTLKSCVISGNSLTIELYCASQLSGDGFGVQLYPNIYVFGRLYEAYGVGLKLRNDAGRLTHAYTDTDGIPLSLRGRVTIPRGSGNMSNLIIPSLVKPAFCGTPIGTFNRSGGATPESSYSSDYWTNYHSTFGFRWVGASHINYQTLLTHFYGSGTVFYSSEPAAIASESLIIEANGL